MFVSEVCNEFTRGTNLICSCCSFFLFSYLRSSPSNICIPDVFNLNSIEIKTEHPTQCPTQFSALHTHTLGRHRRHGPANPSSWTRGRRGQIPCDLGSSGTPCGIQSATVREVNYLEQAFQGVCECL